MSFAPITLPVHRPLLSMESVAAVIEKTPKQITILIEEGRLRTAFDISARRHGHKRCLRVLTSSVAEYLASPTALRAEGEDALVRAIEDLFPAVCASYRSAEVARILATSTEHVSALATAGFLTVLRPGRAGQGCAALITRKSCAEFLSDGLKIHKVRMSVGSLLLCRAKKAETVQRVVDIWVE